MKRPYNKQEMAQLLSKFMAGETTLKEEKVLADLFRTHEVDEEWTEYKEMFALFDRGQVDIESPTRLALPLRWLMAGIAASIILLIGFSLLMKGRKTNEETPEIAQQSIKQPSPQPVSQPVIEEKKEVTILAEVQSMPQPVKRRRKIARKKSTPVESSALTEAEQPIHERDIEAMYAQTEENVTPYHTMQTIHLSSDVVVYVIEASDIPDASTMPSVSELRARGLRLTDHVRQASQTTVQF
jgi:hypothetical protein